jgi:hypothetical protein
MELGASVEVQLVDRDQWLTSCEDAALAWGENLAILGRELLQFGDALPLGNGRFRLSRLVRGVAGTEASAHVAGDLFTLARADSLRPIRLPSSSKGREAIVRARNLNGQEASAALAISEDPLNPPIAFPEGGETVDSEARAALGAALEAMRRHGLIES